MAKILSTDPPRAPAREFPRAPFENDAERNRGMPGLWRIKDDQCRMFTPEAGWQIVSDVPPDEKLIAFLTQAGCPAMFAREAGRHPVWRFVAARVWMETLDAAQGDPEAIERMDWYRHWYQQAREIELISRNEDDPSATIGLFER